MASSGSFGLLNKFAPMGVRRQYAKGRTILFQGEVPRAVLLLQSGLVKAYGITSAGDQRIVTLLSEGDIFPMSWTFGKSSVCMYYYEAITNCTVFAVPKDDYEHTISNDVTLLRQVFDNYMAHYTSAVMHVYALEQPRAQDKLALILQYLVARFGEKLPDGRYKINLHLSHQDIADLVGLTRETAAVELHKMKEKGLIDYQKFTYIIDRKKIVQATGSDEFEGLRVDT